MTFLTYTILVIVFIMFVISKSPKLKGIIGEKFMEYRLSKLDPQKYKILHDVLIPSREGRTTQIDHIVLSEYGIFIIETKNYRGWIVGNEHAEYWTQVIYKRKEKLYNPLRQNYGHVEALKTVLSDITDLHFIPIVSFTARADIKVETKAIVIYNSQINNEIRSYNTLRISSESVEQAYKILNQYKINQNRHSVREHVQTVKHDINYKAHAVSNDICPKCAKELVMKKGKYGVFKGCSGYPKCRYTVK